MSIWYSYLRREHGFRAIGDLDGRCKKGSTWRIRLSLSRTTDSLNYPKKLFYVGEYFLNIVVVL